MFINNRGLDLNMGNKITTALLVGLGMTTLVGCAPRPVQYATRDYASYPQKQDQGALRNIESIFASECEDVELTKGYTYDYKVNEQGLQCRQKVCADYRTNTYKDSLGNSRWEYVCSYYAVDELNISWNEIINPKIIHSPYDGSYILTFTNDKKRSFKARDKRQAEDLAEAIRIYLAKRNRTYSSPTSSPADTTPSAKKSPTITPGCQNDMQCKGNLICVKRACVNP